MKVEIFGMGCPNCSKLEDNVRRALAEEGLEADVVKVDNIEDIVARGVRGTPALAIDGEIRSTAKVLNVNQVRALLR